MNKLNNREVKKHNMRLAYRALLEAETLTKGELAARTNLSIPTIAQIIAELRQAGLVQEGELLESEGGRRPVALYADKNALLSGGMELSQHHLCMAVVNLKGECRAFERIQFPGEEAAAGNVRLIADAYQRFLSKSGFREEALSGIGIAFPGIIDRAKESLSYSHVLRLKAPLDLLPLKNAFSTEVAFFNDATAACMAEWYTGHVPDDFSFISLSNSVGGAAVIRGELVPGYNERGGEYGHILIHPKGRQCYCGQKGHYDPYGSALLLANLTDGSLEGFFDELAGGRKDFAKVFDTYLSDLAILIYNLHVATDLPVIIGGYVGVYLSPYLEQLKKKVSALDLFSDRGDYIFSGHFHYEAASVGGARYFLENRINRL